MRYSKRLYYAKGGRRRPKRASKRKKLYTDAKLKHGPMTVPLSLVPYRRAFPNSIRTTLRYHTYCQPNPGVGAVAVNVYSANGLYDPDITGVGHQPMGFDEYMNAYDHYTVVGSQISVWFQNPTSSTVQCGVALNSGTPTLGTIERYTENGQGKHVVLTGLNYGKSIGEVTMGFSGKKFFNKKDIVGEKDFAGTISANPTEQAYFHVWVGAFDGADVDAINCIVTIDYIVVFHEPQALAQS